MEKSTTETQWGDCTLYHMEQRSDEWYDIRKGKLTASAVGLWMADQPKIDLTVPQIKEELKNCGKEFKGITKRDDLLELLPNPERFLAESKSTTDAREGAIYTALGELAGGVTPSEFFIDPDGPPPSNPAKFAIWNGIRLEPDAVDWFERTTGKKITPVGFARFKGGETPFGNVGCSPDGLILSDNGGLEIKCPLPKTHIKYVDKGVLPDEYRAQVHFSMAVTGADHWHFVSFSDCVGVGNLHLKIERDELTEQFREGLLKYEEHFKAARERMAKKWEEEQERAA